jgi:hypothetical protein
MGLFPKEKPFISIIGNDRISNRNWAIIFLSYFIFALMMVYLLPYDIAEKLPFLRGFIDIMAEIFPSISDIGRYSEFPQSSQLVYSIEILSLPFILIYLQTFMKWELNVDVVLGSPIFCLLLLPLIYLAVPFSIIYLIPGGVDEKNKDDFIKILYISKTMFSFLTSILIVSCSLSIFALISYIKGLPKLFQR